MRATISGFIIHMGRQIAYINCPARSDVKSWMCAILEGVTLGESVRLFVLGFRYSYEANLFAIIQLFTRNPP